MWNFEQFELPEVGILSTSDLICDDERVGAPCLRRRASAGVRQSSQFVLGPNPEPEVCLWCQAAVSDVMFQAQQEGLPPPTAPSWL